MLTLERFQGELDTRVRKWKYFKCSCTSTATGLITHSYTGHCGNTLFPPSLLVDWRFVNFPNTSGFTSGFFTEDTAVMVVAAGEGSLTYVFSKAPPPTDNHGNIAVYRWNPIEERHYDLMDSSMWVQSLGMDKGSEWAPIFYRPLAADLPLVQSYLSVKHFIDPGGLYETGEYTELLNWVKWLTHTYKGMFTTIGEEFTCSPMETLTRQFLPDVVPFSWSIGLMDRSIGEEWLAQRWKEYYDIQHS